MADPNDVRGTKAARAELGKRGVDMTHADIRVLHGVCYIRGTLKAIRGSICVDLSETLNASAKTLRSKPEIREVVIDCVMRS